MGAEIEKPDPKAEARRRVQAVRDAGKSRKTPEELVNYAVARSLPLEDAEELFAEYADKGFVRTADAQFGDPRLMGAGITPKMSDMSVPRAPDRGNRVAANDGRRDVP